MQPPPFRLRERRSQSPLTPRKQRATATRIESTRTHLRALLLDGAPGVVYRTG